MLLSTTQTIEGRPVREYLGVVTGEVIVGANVFKDFLAGVRDFSEAVAALMRECCARLKTMRWQR